MTALDEQIGGSHYKDFAIQPVEFIHRNGIDFLSGNIIKYVCRWKAKGGIEDLKKAKHYVELLIELSDNKSKRFPLKGCENCINDSGECHAGKLGLCDCECHEDDKNYIPTIINGTELVYRCVDCKHYFTTALESCPLCHKKDKDKIEYGYCPKCTDINESVFVKKIDCACPKETKDAII